MSVLWTAGEAAAATGGRATRDFAATGVSIDTRTLAPGDLFVALTDRRDGHDFVAGALAAGAAGALVSRVPAGVDPDAPLVVVDDVLAALGALGRAGRARSRARVAAITGSVGKTSAKEMLRCALACQGRVHAAEASFNNHWGVPLTLARLPAGADFAVLEIGMNQPGEIAPLAALARPDVGLITTIAPAHLAAFGDLDAIAREKAALFAALAPDGTAIYDADLHTAPILAAAAAGARHVTFGTTGTAEVRLVEAASGPGRTEIEAEVAGTPRRIELAAPGRHLAGLALGVLAAAEALGADGAGAARGLAEWRPPAGRGARTRVELDAATGAAVDLIDDAYNANPASMAAALETLAAARPGAGGRRIAVLGDMLELGPRAGAFHADLAELAATASVDVVHCIGPLMAGLWQALPARRRGERAPSAEPLAADIRAHLAGGDVVLVKGSKASAVSTVAEAIRRLGAPAAAQ